MPAERSQSSATTPERPQGMWFRTMSHRERRAFWGCFGGWALDAMDVQIYSLIIPTLQSLNFITSNAQAGLIGSVTLFSSAIGGWLVGVLSDRFGRVRMLQFTILWYSLFTLLSGLAQNEVQLTIFRGLMGFGFGGEWAAGAILIGETIRASYRGRAVGTVQSAWAVGWGLAVLLYVIVFSIAPPAWSWRILFIVGVLPGLLTLYIRRHVKEPEVFTAGAGRNAGAGNFLRIFHPDFLRITILCSLLSIGGQGGYYALTTWLPRFLSGARGLNIFGIGGTLALIIFGAFAGYLFGAWLADRIGRRLMIILCAIGAFAVVIPFMVAGLPTVVFYILCFPLGFFGSAYFSAFGAFFTEQYPTELRGSGQGFCYNFGRGFGAIFPFAVGLLADALSLGAAIAIFAGAAYALMALATLPLSETVGKELS